MITCRKLCLYVIKTQLLTSDHFGRIPRGVILQQQKGRRNPIELKSSPEHLFPGLFQLFRDFLRLRFDILETSVFKFLRRFELSETSIAEQEMQIRVSQASSS